MKLLLRIDFAIQTLLLSFYIIALLFSFTTASALLFVLIAQLAVGLVQMLSTIIMFAKGDVSILRMVHIAFAIAFLTYLFVVHPGDHMLIAPALILALGYYLMTLKKMLRRPKKLSPFLPHISF